jgi:hypothetical protein
MRISNSGSPVSSSDWDDAEFGKDHGSTDGGSDFFRTFDTETNMAITVANDNKCLESSPLTSSSLFLYRANLQRSALVVTGRVHLHDFIFEFRKEVIDNLVFLDGQRMKIDFLQFTVRL